MSSALLAVGWDVGGWVGRKQAVAVAAFGSDRVEWRDTATAFRLADFPYPHWFLLDIIRIAWPDAPDDALERHRVVLAIDAPLGFPRAFTELFTTGVWPSSEPLPLTNAVGKKLENHAAGVRVGVGRIARTLHLACGDTY